MRHGGGASSECEMGQDGICLQSEEAAEETAPQVADDKGCVDTHEMCRDWTKMGTSLRVQELKDKNSVMFLAVNCSLYAGRYC
jgi:hypothetical protein